VFSGKLIYMKSAGASFHRLSPFYLVVISLLVCAEAVFGQSPPRTWAVVIGISRYPGLPGGQQLQFAERDAQSFASALQAGGISATNIRVLLGQQASLPAIKEALGSWLARSAGPQDTVIIFFSGHGYVEHSFDEAYLLAEDSKPQNVFATGLSLAEIRHIVESRIKAGRVVILADSVRKDLFDPDSDGPGLTETFFKATSEIAASKPNTSVIVASSPGEFSWEGRRWGEMGLFTRTLIDGMAGKADKNGDGSVTESELFRFLSDQLPAETSGKQHPWHTRTEATEAVLSRGPSAGSRIATAAPIESAGTDRRKNGKAISEPNAGVRSPATAPSSSQSGATQSGATQSGATGRLEAQAPSIPENRGVHKEAERPSRRPEMPLGAGAATDAPPTAISAAGSTAAGSSKASTDAGAARPAAKGSVAEVPNARVSAASRSPAEPASPLPSRPPAKATGLSQPGPPALGTAEAGGPVTTPGGSVSGIGTREAPPPPRPLVLLPNPHPIATGPEESSRTGPVGRLPVEPAGATPSPLLLQLELALDQGSIVSPSGSSAWDLYQKLVAVDPPPKELSQLKARLTNEMMVRSKAIVAGDIRSDNISTNVDDFRLAGQMLTRLHSFQPDDSDIAKLQKLSAAEALIALQFYDEAVKALEPLRVPATGWVENALGLATLGQLSDFEAERHFKRAIEQEPKWAAPHYNLGLLYRNQKKEDSLAEVEQAARLDTSNPAILAALGDEHFERKHWTEAAAAYRAALTIRPEDGALHTKLGHALYSQGLRDEADKEYQKAKQLAGRRN